MYDVQNQPSEKKIVQPLPNLKPYTYYAFYVKTYTIASARTGAQSEIMYFRTNASSKINNSECFSLLTIFFFSALTATKFTGYKQF